MPVEERSTRSVERCDQHPTRSAVARCERCGRPLCLTCAVPVRGSVLGAECLPEPFAGDVPPAPRPASTPLQLAAGGGLLLALLSTALPWSRFGVGSAAFGAWDQPPRWSSLAAVAAVLGVLAWALRRFLVPDRRAVDPAIAILAGLVGVFALLSIWHPPAFTRTWIGPWVAVLGGAVACAATLAERRTRRERPTPRV